MAQPTAPVQEAVKIVRDVLLAQLGPFGLTNGQIMLTNQKWLIPNNQGLYVALSYVSGIPVSTTSDILPTDSGMQELQQMIMLYEIQIDLMSYDDSARVLKELAYMGLVAFASQNIQQQYNVQLARNVKPFQDISDLEESARMNRYSTTIALTQLIINTVQDIPYYDDFSQAVPPVIVTEQ